MEFHAMHKMTRWSREIIITEKIDGTNASIFIGLDGTFLAGSKNQWITPQKDNYGFATWAHENKEELLKLGVGRHFGEWWGRKIQRNYGLKERVFSLFDHQRWTEANVPKCCRVVPILYQGILYSPAVDIALSNLKWTGSIAQPGFMKPEGVVITHIPSGVRFKKTIENDDIPKSLLDTYPIISYVTTEAGLPILEAGRIEHKEKSHGQ